jgi:hypothetical protein
MKIDWNDDVALVYDDVFFSAVATMPDGRYVTTSGFALKVQGEGAIGTGVNGNYLRPLADGTFIIRSLGDAANARLGAGGTSIWHLKPDQSTSYPSDTDANGDSWSTGNNMMTGEPQLNVIRSDGTPDASGAGASLPSYRREQ